MNRTTVDLSGYPDLVVIYLGMRARSLQGLRTMRRVGGEIRRSVQAGPDGLLRHENLTYSLFPLHIGMRQYWRDLDAMERWTRAGQHREWWSQYLRDTEGTGFWHETHIRGGGMEAIYVDMPPLGIAAFAPNRPARGAMFSARQRIAGPGTPPPAVVPEEELV